MIAGWLRGRTRLALLLGAIPLLVGSQCVVLFSSGDGSDDKDKEEDETLIVATSSGTLGSIPIAGVDYTSGSLRGVTGSGGEFEYEQGQAVSFAIGDIALGGPVDGGPRLTIADLAGEADPDAAAVVNRERLLFSLDARPGDGVVSIPPGVREKARRSNSSAALAIEFLDFSDNTAFVNAASQLVAVLTADYPFTAVLVDAQDVRNNPGGPG